MFIYTLEISLKFLIQIRISTKIRINLTKTSFRLVDLVIGVNIINFFTFLNFPQLEDHKVIFRTLFNFLETHKNYLGCSGFYVKYSFFLSENSCFRACCSEVINKLCMYLFSNRDLNRLFFNCIAVKSWSSWKLICSLILHPINYSI